MEEILLVLKNSNWTHDTCTWPTLTYKYDHGWNYSHTKYSLTNYSLARNFPDANTSRINEWSVKIAVMGCNAQCELSFWKNNFPKNLAFFNSWAHFVMIHFFFCSTMRFCTVYFVIISPMNCLILNGLVNQLNVKFHTYLNNWLTNN